MFDDVPKTQTVSEPGLKDLLDLHKRDVMLSMNCHHIGVIDEFDPFTQTATITIPYKKTFFKKNPLNDDLTPFLVEYPPIVDCPVMFLGGGAGSLRFPVKKGDECLLLFNDRDIDNWFSGSQSSATASLRLHSFSDAIALVGVRSKLKTLKGFDPDKTQLVHGDKVIYSFEDDKVSLVFKKDENTVVGYNATETEAELVWGDKGRVKAAEDQASLAVGDKTLIKAGDSKLQLKNESQNIKVILQTLIDKLVDLDGKIQDLISAIAQMSFGYASPGGPANTGPAVNAASITAITSDIASVTQDFNQVKSDVGELFE